VSLDRFLTKEEKWWHANFPSKFARVEADKAVDTLPASDSMEKHIDVWISAYKRAGGRTRW
jgi:hypothetical protein